MLKQKKGYQIHTISTVSGSSKGLMGGDRIYACTSYLFMLS